MREHFDFAEEWERPDIGCSGVHTKYSDAGEYTLIEVGCPATPIECSCTPIQGVHLPVPPDLVEDPIPERAKVLLNATKFFFQNFERFEEVDGLLEYVAPNNYAPMMYQLAKDDGPGGMKEEFVSPNRFTGISIGVYNVSISPPDVTERCTWAGRRSVPNNVEDSYRATIGGLFANTTCERIWYDIELHSEDDDAPGIPTPSDYDADALQVWRGSPRADGSCKIEKLWTADWGDAPERSKLAPRTNPDDLRFVFGQVMLDGHSYRIEVVLNNGVNDAVEAEGYNDYTRYEDSSRVCTASTSNEDGNFWTDLSPDDAPICQRFLVKNPYDITVYNTLSPEDLIADCLDRIAEENEDRFRRWAREELAYQISRRRSEGLDCITRAGVSLMRSLTHENEAPESYLEHHITLYYYDQAGNLIATVPPEGFRPDGGSVQLTTYAYNSVGQLTRSESPDEGLVETLYDFAQRPRLRRDAQQAREQTYTYTKYDRLGRVTEAGEARSNRSANPDDGNYRFDELSDPKSLLAVTTLNNVEGYPITGAPGLRDRTITTYNATRESVRVNGRDFTQGNLRGRVASVRTADVTSGPSIATYYDYDVHGNVAALAHRTDALAGHDVRIDYTYDLISGNVRELAYNPGEDDAFRHRYRYDDDNRLTHAYFSDDPFNVGENGAAPASQVSDRSIFDLQARYRYYAHGPLARVEVGPEGTQGIDYAYTLQGWIKGTGAQGTPGSGDPGFDGQPNTPYADFTPDAAAYGLGYYVGDYSPIGVLPNEEGDFYLEGTSPIGQRPEGGPFGMTVEDPYNSVLQGRLGASLYNGNVSWMRSYLRQADALGGQNGRARSGHAMAYAYDQLHRLREARGAYEIQTQYGRQVNGSGIEARFAYDANGNLRQLRRTGGGALGSSTSLRTDTTPPIRIA